MRADQGQHTRTGNRVNSRVPIAIRWTEDGRPRTIEAKTIDTSSSGCLALASQGIEVGQAVQLVNLINGNECDAGNCAARPAGRLDVGVGIQLDTHRTNSGDWTFSHGRRHSEKCSGEGIFDELFSLLEELETQNVAIVRFLKEEGIATNDKFAPYLDRAASAAREMAGPPREDGASVLANSSGRAGNKKEESGGKKEAAVEELEGKQPSRKYHKGNQPLWANQRRVMGRGKQRRLRSVSDESAKTSDCSGCFQRVVCVVSI
jgi:hypothetical protein